MYLEKIQSPQDLKKLSPDELWELAKEMRQRIIEVVAITGGHLASSLGVVELTIALHYCLNAPKDKIIWDVGHQAYPHKIITGRNKRFTCLRQFEGVSPFPSKDESPFDTFSTGHSSTAVSLALGLVCARDALPIQEQFQVAAVIGDGSLSGGLCFEGLNNAGHLRKDLLVVLNTNELSIAPNVGAVSTYLNKLISLPIYNRFHSSLENLLKSRFPKGSRLIKMAGKFEENLKGLFVPGIFFEEMGFRYFGPLDGHNLNILIPTLKNIIGIKGPKLVHVVTKKGKGYLPAETNPVRFHGIGPFDIKTGEPIVKKTVPARTFTEVFSDKLVDLARQDKSIVAITAAMPEGTGLDRFRDAYPERFFDVGIAEEHAVCFAAGLAAKNLKPVVAIYSTFLQRSYDQIIESVALQNLPVVFALDRAGVVGEDGATHQGIFDIAYLRHIPNLLVMAPADALEAESMLSFALQSGSPCTLRYPKGQALTHPLLKSAPIQKGGSVILSEGSDFVLIALGSMVVPALAAAEILRKKGITGSVVNARFVKPLDKEAFLKLAQRIKKIFTVEEGVLEGGFGSAVMEAINLPVERIGLPAQFIPCGKREMFLKIFGLDAEGIAKSIEKGLG